MPDLHRHGYSIADLVLSDSACERIVESIQPTVDAMVRDPRFQSELGEPGLVVVNAIVLEGDAGEWRQSSEVTTVQVSLDPGGAGIRVIPMSHRQGKLSEEELARLTASGPIADLTLPQGAMLVMAPRLVHTTPNRRVLQIELASPPR